MKSFCTWLLLLLLFPGCGGDPEPARDESGDPGRACDICGLGDGRHRLAPDTPDTVRNVALRDGGAERIQQPGSADTHREMKLCPRVFGELPRTGRLRVLAPICGERKDDRQVWTWIVVSARPIDSALAESLGVTLRCGPEKGAPGVWLVTLTVDRQSRRFGPIAHATLTNHRATGGHTGTIGTGADIPADATLADLVVVSRAEVLAEVPTRVLLATVDGNPVTLDLTLGEDSFEPKPRYRWTDAFSERIYAGRQPSDLYDPEWRGEPDPDRQVENEADADSRALAYLAHHGVEDWGEPARVTRTALNHYRVEFEPAANGRGRALIVDPKNGYVDHPRHPR